MYRLLSAALGVAFLAGATPVADAQTTARQMRQQVEASMLVTGHVDIDLDGRVTRIELDQPDSLPPYVTGLIEGSGASLRFEPILVDGAPVLARATMSVRLAATPAENGEMDIRIAGAHFGEQYRKDDTSQVRAASLPPPRYPAEMAHIGGQGIVYLLIKVGPDGSTQDVHAEQVNLTALGTERQMERVRKGLAMAATSHARRMWSWTPPTTGELAGRDHWIVRIPVDFSLDRAPGPRYGQWSSYHPGVASRPAWSTPPAPGFRADALASGGGATPEVSRFKLLTPFEG